MDTTTVRTSSVTGLTTQDARAHKEIFNAKAMHPAAADVSESQCMEEFCTTHGPIIGEVTETSALVWLRSEASSEPLRLTWWAASSSEGGADSGSTRIELLPDADNTSKTLITGLRPGTSYELRVGHRPGHFKTPGASAISFVFGSCLGGQGIGRNDGGHASGPGFPIFEAMARLQPDFVHINGDSIYADNAIEAVSTQFHNQGARFITPAGLDVIPAATSLDGFRSRYKYHLEDPAYSAFLASTPVSLTWDDHEITDDWGAEAMRAKGLGQLLEDGKQAFFEYWPLRGVAGEPQRLYRRVPWGPHAELLVLDCRQYRSAHDAKKEGVTPQMRSILGVEQKAWLHESLSASRATWKFICTSIPLSYPTGWPRPEETGYDGWADGNPDGISGPELELMAVVEQIRDEQITGVLFLSGDVHFPFCLSYDPFRSGRPLFHEIACTPFQALCLPPPAGGPRDLSFNPTLLFAAGEFAGTLLNFGHCVIDEAGALTFTIRDVKGTSIYELALPNPTTGA